jgi:hypothetical protein
MKLLATFVILLSTSLNAVAVGYIDNATVTQVRVDKSGIGYVTFNIPIYGEPASCTQAGYTNVLAFNTNEAGGRAILSIVLAAQASGKKIRAAGTGTCPSYGIIEDWSWGLIATP